MTTAMDRYFEIVNSAGSDLTGLDGLGELFAEDVLLMDCGDMVRGRDLAVGVHREQAAARKGSTRQWTVSAQADGTLTGNWSRSGLDAHGNAESASGHFTASLGPDGRIALLHLTLTAGSDRARLAIARHLEVWMTPDPIERARAMEGIYTEDIEILEPEDVFVGRDTINDYIAVVQSKAPPLSGRITSHTQNKDYILWGWDFGFPGDKRALGTEVLHMRGDLIEKIVIFSGDGDVFTEGTR